MHIRIKAALVVEQYNKIDIPTLSAWLKKNGKTVKSRTKKAELVQLAEELIREE